MLSQAFSADFRNDAALEGLKTVKVVFDVNTGNSSLLAGRLDLILITYNQLKEFGQKPEFVVAFRGPATRFMIKGDLHVQPDQLSDKNRIQESIKKFNELGFSLEQCAIAAQAFGVEVRDFLPEITLVANGYISLIGYQNKGYAFLPME